MTLPPREFWTLTANLTRRWRRWQICLAGRTGGWRLVGDIAMLVTTWCTFVVCCKYDRHIVIAARDDDMLMLRLIVLQVGQADMVIIVLSPAEPANVQSLIGIAGKLTEYRTAAQLVGQGVQPSPVYIYGEILTSLSNRLAIIVTQQPQPVGTTTRRRSCRGVRLRAGQFGVAAPPRWCQTVQKLSAGHSVKFYRSPSTALWSCC